jgi:hypothetical protein
MQRRQRGALLAAAVVLAAGIIGLSGWSSAGRSTSSPRVASTLAPEAQQPRTTDHADHAAVPALRISTFRSADLRVDLPRVPWPMAFGAAALALLVAGGPAWTVGPAIERVPRTATFATRRVRGPPRSV